MSLLLNIELWNNSRPRQAGFDIVDYCGAGDVGNTCTGDVWPGNRVATELDDLLSTANATHDAWLKAVNEWFLSTISFYYDIDICTYSNIVNECVNHEGELMLKCITVEEFAKIIEAYYGEEGFIGKWKKWSILKQEWWNSLRISSDPYKLNGIQSYTQTINAPIGSVTTWTYTIDYTEWQSANNEKYLEYRNAMGDMMQSLKRLMQMCTGSSFETYRP